MKRCAFFGITLALACAAITACSNDATQQTSQLCGNNTLDDKEICDGSLFKDGSKVCPAGLILIDENAFTCTDSCGLDISMACAVPTCGDGMLNGSEVCDGELFADGAKACPGDFIELDNPIYTCTKTCQIDISKACRSNNTCAEPEKCPECEDAPQCGDDKLAPNELCDGDLFADGAKACPGDMVELETPAYACTDKCQLDITQACVSSICGDKKVTGLEKCDGNLFADGAKACPTGYKPISGRDLFACDRCSIDALRACIPENEAEPTLYFSEIRMKDNDSGFAHLYLEIGNLGYNTTLSDCKLLAVKLGSDGTSIDPKPVKEYPLADIELGTTSKDPNQVYTICHEQKDGWLKSQYDETSTMELCNGMYVAAETTNIACYDSCPLNNKTCEDACYQAYLEYQKIYNECTKKADYRKIDEACDVYIPASDTTLNFSRTKSNYKNDKIWGLALSCGENIYDVVKVAEITEAGAQRMCPNGKLDSIKATGNTILKSYQGNTYDDLFSNLEYNRTYKRAVCGTIVIY